MHSGGGATTITVLLSEQAVRLPSAYVYTQRFMLFCLDDSFLVVLNLEPCTCWAMTPPLTYTPSIVSKNTMPTQKNKKTLSSDAP